ncbi:glycerol-3-phosphate responsive antiterminator [Psychrobacillus sp. FSL K6-4046]|uniref:glycerol-3-phosphate responsive antiterminator n=1 Tax=unclassified Psychrobacillus TaxID=2636677 RepID=UPI00203AF0EE|nr:glycerol-3-phosphate responsive antiterminator [Psychrobacillus sp. MER TA 171]MCM3357946.1 glycerol-3-phosphate responsive antiterminator [Psychrobacillus sp. MER TA 171]
MSLVDMVESQIIAAVTNEQDLKQAITSKANIVFLLTGNLMTAGEHINKIKQANKYVFIHLDFIDGISSSKTALTFVADQWKPTGIITTKSHVVKLAKEVGLMTIQRIFLLDRNAVTKGIEMVNSCRPDAVEVMPGIMPKVIDQLCTSLTFPIIAGGLIDNISEVHQALENGALAISAGVPEMWNFNL